MQVEVQSNPNCEESEQFVFNELDAPKPIRGIKMVDRGLETHCDVIGVTADGQWKTAHAVKITDSGSGYAFLIYGGDWGIRLRPTLFQKESWDLTNKHQWGEPFKIYGSTEDILYKGENV